MLQHTAASLFYQLCRTEQSLGNFIVFLRLESESFENKFKLCLQRGQKGKTGCKWGGGRVANGNVKVLERQADDIGIAKIHKGLHIP